MNYCEKQTEKWGKVLWITTDFAEVGIALDFGIRVVHISCPGMENLCYEQPKDLSDGCATPQGWKVYGGHRMWLAPECDQSYCPDNDPVSYEIQGASVLVTQDTEPWLGIQKQLRLTFRENAVDVENIFINRTDKEMTGASWGVNTLAAGGTAKVDFAGTKPGDYTPRRIVSLWADTNVHDARVRFDQDSLTAIHKPLADYFKMGLYVPQGKAVYENKGQRLTLTFPAEGMGNYPDNGCNFELYLGRFFMELETMGVVRTMAPGDATSHVETWQLEKL